MHLTALVESPDHVCCRYRLAMFRPWLERAGHQLDLHPLPGRWWSGLRPPAELHAADVVILQRRLLPRWQLYLLRRAARFLVFDFDDAVFLHNSYSPRGLYSAKRLRRFAATCRAADAVVAGNGFLHDQAERWAGRVEIIPTCIDPRRYPVAAHDRTGAGVQLAWVGSSSTLKGLEAIRPVLDDIGGAVPGLSLKVICNRFPQFAHLPVLACPWSEATEGEELAAADIGISWVPDDLWSQGKCGLKVLQFMAAGLPVIANPVGVQATIVRHDENGFLAETPAEWVEAVGRLAHDPELRRRMGRAGRRLVETSYSMAFGAARWTGLLGGLVRRRAAA